MTLTASPFPPIADYAFLSNCHTAALVAPDGSTIAVDQIGDDATSTAPKPATTSANKQPIHSHIEY